MPFIRLYAFQMKTLNDVYIKSTDGKRAALNVARDKLNSLYKKHSITIVPGQQEDAEL